MFPFNLAAEGREISTRTQKTVTKCDLQDWNVIVDLGAVLLSHAFGDPDDVAALLFLKFQVRVEDSEVELLHECVDIQFHLKWDQS